MNEILNILLKLERPLEFASRNSYASLTKLRGIEALANSVTKEALENRGGEKRALLIDQLKRVFIAFDGLPVEEKKTRIETAKKLVESIKKSPGSSELPVLSNIKTKQPESLDMSIKYLKGVGEKRARLFEKLGIETVRDALMFVPLRYEDRSTLKKVVMLTPGIRETVQVKVLSAGVIRPNFSRNARRGRNIYQVVFRDNTGRITGKWFNFRAQYMEKKFAVNSEFILNGEVKFNSYTGELEVVHPDVESIEGGKDETLHVGRITPVYSLTEGLHQKTTRAVMKGVVDRFASEIPEHLPTKLLVKCRLAGINDSFLNVHFPQKGTSLAELENRSTSFHRRLIFDEFFFLELGLARKKKRVKEEKRVTPYRMRGELIQRFTKTLPFKLTAAQERVIKEIEKDLASDTPMNRLLQGDVGSGKTVVALHAMLTAVESGFQASIMSPTEILAEQHYKNIKKIVEPLNLSIALLTSSTKGVGRRKILEELATGKIEIIVGTHSLIQEEVTFKKLGIAVVDEQHRFGVLQRGVIKKKGLNSDVLIMTATPIPRTLAMTVYGDLDVSIINEMPAGRKPITTRLLFGKRGREVFPVIKREVKKGRQAYMVFPLVEESDKLELMAAVEMAEKLKQEIFPELNVGLIHGRMKADEKEKIMCEFRDGKIHLLVSTTVVEVGLDIPNATIMVIEHAERFGLSQLHQLRGRVGRGDKESFCLLVAHYPLSDEGKKRLRVMTQSQDGFYIAEKDLEIRGPGQFLGTKQSGLPEFKVGNLIRDQELLTAARDEAFAYLKSDPLLSRPENGLIREILKKNWNKRLELADIG